MGPPVTCFHWSRDLSSSARHGPGGASFTLGALASPPSAGGLAHHRTCLRRSPLGYPSAGRIHRAPRYLWSTVPESRSVAASLQKTTLPRALGCQSLSSDPSDVPASPAVAALHSLDWVRTRSCSVPGSQPYNSAPHVCFTIGCLHFHACLPVIDDCLLCCDPCLQLQALGLPRGSSNVT